jgi:hypothetical protein
MIMARQSDSRTKMDSRSIEDFMPIEEATAFSGYTGRW